MPGAASPDTNSVRASRRGAVLLIELGNPNGFPRLTRALLEELHQQFNALDRIAGVRAAVLTGTEKCFAAGADLAEVGALQARDALRFSELGQSLMRKIERQAKPILAAICGYCLGGGLDLALACQLRIASSDAVFGHPGAGLGILTGWGGTQRLPRVMGPRGRARTLEMLSTARTITASEAHAWGLVNRVVPSTRVLEAALRLALNATGET